MRKVFLVNPPLYFDKGEGRFLDCTVPPLGIMYIASYIKKHGRGIKAEVIDFGGEKINLKEFEERVKRERPWVVGISAMTAQLQGGVGLAKFIKKKFREIIVFLGGAHISADEGFIERMEGFDYGIKGEGERTFLEALEKLKQGREIKKVMEGKAVDDLDELMIDESLFKKENYQRRQSVIFSRGCPFDCYFCSRPAVAKKVRYRSVENLIKEIEKGYQYYKGKIDFQDDTFTLDKEKVMEFCEEVMKKELLLEWRCNTRIDRIDEKLVEKMAKAGCKVIYFGIEAGSEEIRKKVVKKGNFSNKDIKRIFSACKKEGVKTGVYFILGHPGEKREEIEETRKLIFDLGTDVLGVSLPTPFPGSKLYEIAKRKGIINEKIIDRFAKGKLGKGYKGNYPVLVSEKVGRKEAFRQMKEINRRFYINYKVILKRLAENWRFPKKIMADIKDFLCLLINGVSLRKPYRP